MFIKKGFVMQLCTVVGVCSAIVALVISASAIADDIKTQTNGGSMNININGNGNIVINGRSFVSGSGVEGNGRLEKEQRSIGPFSAISVEMGADVHYRPGKSEAVGVQADSNLLPLIRTEVANGILRIYTQDSFVTRNKVDVYVAGPSLTSLSIQGSGDAMIEGVQGESLTLDVAGSGNIDVTGEVQNLEATISGSGNIDAGRLIAASAIVRVNGSGDASIYCKDSIEAAINGSGDVTVHGQPAQQRIAENGSGRVRLR